jgi:hypothetical protein
LRLDAPTLIAVGQPIDIKASVTDGRTLLDGVRVRTRISAPRASVDDYIRKYGDQLARIRIPAELHADGKPDKARQQLAQLVLLRDNLKAKTGEDILAPAVRDIVLGEATVKTRAVRGTETTSPRGGQDVALGAGALAAGNVLAGGGPGRSIAYGTVLDPRLVQRPRHAGVLSGQFVDTKVPGSYTVQVTATGFSPACNSRFVRHDLLSIAVAQKG